MYPRRLHHTTTITRHTHTHTHKRAPFKHPCVCVCVCVCVPESISVDGLMRSTNNRPVPIVNRLKNTHTHNGRPSSSFFSSPSFVFLLSLYYACVSLCEEGRPLEPRIDPCLLNAGRPVKGSGTQTASVCVCVCVCVLERCGLVPFFFRDRDKNGPLRVPGLLELVSRTVLEGNWHRIVARFPWQPERSRTMNLIRLGFFLPSFTAFSVFNIFWNSFRGLSLKETGIGSYPTRFLFVYLV